MAILTADELATVRRDYRSASLLPARTYHDPAVFDWEQDNIMRRDWVLVARVEDIAEPGAFLVREVLDESVLLVRGRDDQIRAFYNVCRHRGTAVEERDCGQAVRFQCPYHAWIYDLDGKLIRAKHTDDLEDFTFAGYGLPPIRTETWQGFVFLCFADESVTPPLLEQLGDLVDQFERFDFTTLRSAHQITYDVGANWKFIAENYSECYHCPGVHPQLNRLTPYDLGGDYDSNGAWQGGWMELVEGAETMALDGGHGSRDGRPPMCGITPVDEQRIYYYVLWPNAFLSVHPDYLLVHRLVPHGPGRTTVICDWLFEADTIAMDGFDPKEAIDFWDVTNRQDWHVCELQQRGTASRSWVAGRYSDIEPSVQAFDLMVADRYAGDGVVSQRLVRDTYAVPDDDDDVADGADGAADATNGNGNGNGHAPDRAARRRERTGVATD